MGIRKPRPVWAEADYKIIFYAVCKQSSRNVSRPLGVTSVCVPAHCVFSRKRHTGQMVCLFELLFFIINPTVMDGVIVVNVIHN